MSIHIMKKDLNNPYFADLLHHHQLTTSLCLVLYASLFCLVILPFSILHFIPDRTCRTSSRSRAWAMRARRWASGRWVLSLGRAKEGVSSRRWNWDLRGNRGLLSLFLLLAIYDFLACFVGTNPTTDPGLFAMPKHRLIANRAGNLCFAQLPLIMLLVTRKNALASLTGASLPSLVFLHRWIGWSTFFLGFVHIGIYGSYAVNPADNFAYLRAALGKGYYLWGLVAAGAFGVVVGGSVPWVRRRWHEVFLVSHVLGSVVFFGSCVFHWKPRKIWPLLAIAIYASTRLHRVFLLVHTHILAPLEARLRSDQKSSVKDLVGTMGPANAVVEVLDERAMRIEVEVAEGVRWEAGQWVLLSFVGKGLGRGEWHPFSIASLPSPSRPPSSCASPHSFRSPISLPSRSLTSSPETLPLLSSLPLTSSNSPPASLYTLPDTYPPNNEPSPGLTNTSKTNTMSFIVTPHSSLTRRVYDLALSHSHSLSGAAAALHTPVLIEGPYGVPPHLKGAETVVLVAGGTGMAYASSLWRQLVRHPGGVKKVVVVWSVRERHHLEWVDLGSLVAESRGGEGVRVETHWHYTNPPSSPGYKAVDAVDGLVEAHLGRPDLQRIIQGASDEAEEGRVQVIVCGPKGLADGCVDVVGEVCDPRRVGRGEEGGDVRVEVEGGD